MTHLACVTYIKTLRSDTVQCSIWPWYWGVSYYRVECVIFLSLMEFHSICYNYLAKCTLDGKIAHTLAGMLAHALEFCRLIHMLVLYNSVNTHMWQESCGICYKLCTRRWNTRQKLAYTGIWHILEFLTYTGMLGIQWCKLPCDILPSQEGICSNALVSRIHGRSWHAVADLGFSEGGFCYSIAREKFATTPTFC